MMWGLKSILKEHQITTLGEFDIYFGELKSILKEHQITTRSSLHDGHAKLKSILKEHQITTQYCSCIWYRKLKSILKEHQITTRRYHLRNNFLDNDGCDYWSTIFKERLTRSKLTADSLSYCAVFG